MLSRNYEFYLVIGHMDFRNFLRVYTRPNNTSHLVVNLYKVV